MKKPHQPVSIPSKSSDVEFDVVIVGAGFGGMYMLYKARKQGLKCRVYETRSGVGGHGIGTAIQAPAVTWKVCNIRISFRTNYSRNGNGAKNIRLNQKFSNMPTMLLIALIYAAI